MPWTTEIHRYTLKEWSLGIKHPLHKPLSGSCCEVLSFARSCRDLKPIAAYVERAADFILGPIGLTRIQNKALLFCQLLVFTDCPKILRFCRLNQILKR